MKDNQLKDSDDQSFNEPDFLQPGPKTGSEGLGDHGSDGLFRKIVPWLNGRGFCQTEVILATGELGPLMLFLLFDFIYSQLH